VHPDELALTDPVRPQLLQSLIIEALEVHVLLAILLFFDAPISVIVFQTFVILVNDLIYLLIEVRHEHVVLWVDIQHLEGSDKELS